MESRPWKINLHWQEHRKRDVVLELAGRAGVEDLLLEGLATGGLELAL